MDGKEIKSLLKQAREAIRSKEYKEALKHCKSILKYDKDNYNALVFVGVAAEGLDQRDQAVMAYRKAMTLEPAQLLAWQGLCGLYEKMNLAEDRADLVDVYLKLSELYASEKCKLGQVTYKLGQLYCTMGHTDKALVTYQGLLESCEHNEPRRQQLLSGAAELIESLSEPSAEHLAQLKECYECLLLCEPDVSRPLLWEKYINLLVKLHVDNDLLWTKCLAAADSDASLQQPRQVLCQIYLDKNTSQRVEDMAVRRYVDQLASFSTDSEGLVNLVNGLRALNEKQFSQAELVLKTGLQNASKNISGWFYLASCQLAMHQTDATLSSITSAQRLLTRGDVSFHGDKDDLMMRLSLLEALVCLDIASPTSLTKAADISQKVLEVDPSHQGALDCLIRTHIKCNNVAMATQVLVRYKEVGGEDTASCQLLQALLHQANSDTAQMLLSIQKAVAMDTNNAEALLVLSEVYWGQSQWDVCFSSLLKAAKLDPYRSATFVSLGRYYEQVLHDVGKAARCYRKAYDLDPGDDHTGAVLVDSLNTAGDQEGALQVLTSVTSNAVPGSCKWAWLRLGIYQLQHEDPTAAVSSLQSALRADPTDRHCWEAVGDAYLARGSYTAAVKAFTKATELDEAAVYAFYRIGCIKHALAQYLEAINDFKQVLQHTPGYVPALKGTGEAYLEEAKRVMKQGLHQRAVDYCQQALLSLADAVLRNTELACLWKLLGDACNMMHPLPPHMIRMELPSQLLAAGGGRQGSTQLDKPSLLTLGIRCYGMALKRQPDNSCLWHDLGLAYFHQLQQLPLPAATADKKQLSPLGQKSVDALQQAVTLQPGNYLHWTALGVVAASQYISHPGLAQHCFIKAIQLEFNNVVAWTNLGTLYLKHENIELAHQAFKMAQSLEPSYVACWLGQALIADTLAPAEAMDLYRHTCELSMTHPQAALGYTSWVCTTLLNQAGNDKMAADHYNYVIHQMAAIPAAADAMTIFTDRVCDDAVAFNLLGLMLERQQLLSSASSAYLKALNLVKDSGNKTHIDLVRENVARVLSANGRYEEAVGHYTQLPVSFSATCGLALTLCRAGQLQESKTAYESALKVCPTEGDVSHVQTALGMVNYMLGLTDQAKSALFSSSQSSSPSQEGLQALLAMALLAKDLMLASAVLKELGQAEQCMVDLMSASHVLKGDVEAGKRCIAKAIHRSPGEATSWHHLAKFSLDHLPSSPDLAHACYSAASLYTDVTHEWSALVGVLSGLLQSTPDSLRRAQKAVHTQPDSLSAWCTLLCCGHADLVMERSQERSQSLTPTLLTVATHIMAWVEAELSSCHGDKSRLRSLHVWSVCQYVVALHASGMHHQGAQFIQQAVWLYDNDVRLQGLAAMFDCDVTKLQSLAPNDPSGYAWQLLSELYAEQGAEEKVVSCYKQLAAQARCGDEMRVALVLLAHYASKRIQSEDDVERWSALVGECTQMVLCDGQVSPASVAVQLIQGITANSSGKRKVAKRSLQYVINHSCEGRYGDHAARVARVLLEEQEPSKAKQAEPGADVDENDKYFMDG